MIGFLGGFDANIDIRHLIFPLARVQGIAVGSRSQFEAMNRAIDAHGLRPAMDDRVFALAETKDAFALMAEGGHFGKIAISLA